MSSEAGDWPQEIKQAAERIRPYVRSTPCLEYRDGVVLKLEQLQVTGSFKPRGMFNRMLCASVPPAGVVAASGGNAGLAVAYAARRLGHRASIYVPTPTPAVKIARIEEYGGEVHQVGATYNEALEASARAAAASGAIVVHAYDQPEVVAGAGTVAMELPALDTVLVAVGGGGLIGGIAAWFAGSARVVGVEPDGCPTLAEAMRAGGPVDVETGGVASDSLGARRLGELAWAEVERGHVSDSLVISGQAVLDARRELWSEARIATEPGGATAYAALSSGAYERRPGERVAVIVCGANASPGDLG
ncbi:MAG TPA: threonine/serine dehydratase [Acidimicrobiales bacterium]|nr:threonine/serine dehydratase [Acidimicrobiales bacterium]